MSAEAEVYREAASLIRKHGWVQGKGGNPDIGFCTVGAVIEAAWNPLRLGFDNGLQEGRLSRLAGVPHVAAWNDDPHRTVEDVLTLLEQAATEAEKEEMSQATAGRKQPAAVSHTAAGATGAASRPRLENTK